MAYVDSPPNLSLEPWIPLPALYIYISCTLVTVNKPLTFDPEKPAFMPESVPSALTVTCKTFGQQCYVIRSSA